MLDRDGDYWTVVPNRERYAYRIGDIPVGSPDVTIVTIGREDQNWSRVATFPNLEELTLHEPTQEQMEAVGKLQSLKRLRVTHARPKTIGFVQRLVALEELVLEYVSGFSDLAPLRELPRLRAVHFENLRAVSDFEGLSGLTSLKYLAVYGTTDWKQPMASFEFLRGLPSLQVLALWQVINKSPYPALLPALSLASLKKLQIHRSYLNAPEYALLEEGLQGVDGATWGPYQLVAHARMPVPSDDIRARLPEDVIRSRHPEVLIEYSGRRTIEDPASRWFEFTGKGAGRVKQGSAQAERKCRAYEARYEQMKREARLVIDRQRR